MYNCIEDISHEQRLLFLTQVRRFGDLNTNAILDSTCKTFAITSIDGFIGYRIESGCAIVFGDPLCSSSDQLELAKAFKIYCEQHHLNVIYVIISEEFVKSAINQFGSVAIQFGHKIILDPSDNPLDKAGPKASLVRRKVKHAIKDNVTITEYFGADPALENAMEEVGHNWLGRRCGPQIYIAHPRFFKDRIGKRWFYAKQGDRVVGFLILNQIESGNSWLLNNLITIKDAPHGTSELLITSVLKILKSEKCKRVIAGPIVSKEIEHIEGLKSISSWLIRMIFKVSKIIFRLDKQTMFWDKFQPKVENSYVMFEKVSFQSLKALLSAMNVQI